MHICIIADDVSVYSKKRFLKEAAKAGHTLSFVSWKRLTFNGERDTLSTGKNVLLEDFDVVILRSSADAITPLHLVVEYCKDKKICLLNSTLYDRLKHTNKLNQQVVFRAHNIPCLETLYGERLNFSSIKGSLGLPFVAKIAIGSHGKQVFKIRSSQEFSQFTEDRKQDRQLYLFQKYHKISGDYRVFVIGKNVFGAVKRIAPKGEWRTNVRGSLHERAEGEKRVMVLARSIGEKLGVDFAGLDILIDSTGKARVIEINTTAQFHVFEKIFPEINIVEKTLELLKQKAAL